MKKADTNGVHELGRATDFESGLSSISMGSWLRVHDVGSTSLGQLPILDLTFQLPAMAPGSPGGAFHVGVQIMGREYSYGYAPNGSGVLS